MSRATDWTASSLPLRPCPVATGCGETITGTQRQAGAVASTAAATAEPAVAAPTGSGVVSVDDNAKLGKIIVDADGNSLYLFEKDKGTATVDLLGACAQVWPPYEARARRRAEGDAPKRAAGHDQAQRRQTQVTYAGCPLYPYVGDKSPGDTNGNDFEQFGAEWYALTPSGEKPED